MACDVDPMASLVAPVEGVWHSPWGGGIPARSSYPEHAGDGVGFILKGVVYRFCFPLGLSLTLCLAGLMFWPLRSGRCPQPRRRPATRRRPGLVAGSPGLDPVLVFRQLLTAWRLLAPTERQAGDYADPATLVAQEVKTIVVLGTGVHQSSCTDCDRLKAGTAPRGWEEAVRL